MTTTFENAQIGDRVWCVLYGWSTVEAVEAVEAVEEYSPWPLKTNKGSYLYDGRLTINSGRTLFWDEVKITPPEKPLPKLEVDTKLLVWDSEGEVKQKRYFSHFDEFGRMYVFAHGTTSWSYPQTLAYKYWILADA